MHRRIRFTIAVLALSLAGLVSWIGISSIQTEQEIADHAETVRRIAGRHPSIAVDPVAMEALPIPVQRYLAFAIPSAKIQYQIVTLSQEGDFRRPMKEDFTPTMASQTIAVGTPAMVFAATTPIVPGVWARAYDFFAEGRMEMRAKIVSTLTVVDESATEALNRTSLRRWLLESPLYPVALLPGGPVRWEAIDNNHARATVSGFGLEAALVATFRPDGSLESLHSEEDGDLTTPYHGSGEHTLRGDYRLVSGMMIPHEFVISRAAGGKIYPFWKGHITAIAYE